jgi:hypothetical protein
MVDSPDPIKYGSPLTPATSTAKSPDKHAATDAYQSQSQAPNSAHSFLKKMFPQATEDQINQLFDGWMKTIASAIQQNQKFHEEQRDMRKQESGDEGEL